MPTASGEHFADCFNPTAYPMSVTPHISALMTSQWNGSGGVPCSASPTVLTPYMCALRHSVTKRACPLAAVVICAVWNMNSIASAYTISATIHAEVVWGGGCHT